MLKNIFKKIYLIDEADIQMLQKADEIVKQIQNYKKIYITLENNPIEHLVISGSACVVNPTATKQRFCRGLYIEEAKLTICDVVHKKFKGIIVTKKAFRKNANVLEHEIGHHLYFKDKKLDKTEWFTAYGLEGSVTLYGKISIEEGFCEAFGLYIQGKTEKFGPLTKAFFRKYAV